jgi:hypothetical protein
MDGFPVLMPGLPFPPFCRLVPAWLTAVTRQRIIRPENPATAFQQTTPAPGPASTALSLRTSSFSLILEMSWRMFTRAHGSWLLPEGSSPEGDPVPLRGALSASRVLLSYLPVKFRSETETIKNTLTSKNIGRAIYLNLNLKNYRKALHTTYKVPLYRLAGFFRLCGQLAALRPSFPERDSWCCCLSFDTTCYRTTQWSCCPTQSYTSLQSKGVTPPMRRGSWRGGCCGRGRRLGSSKRLTRRSLHPSDNAMDSVPVWRDR